MSKPMGYNESKASRKFIALSSYIKKPERAQIKDASSALKKNNPDHKSAEAKIPLRPEQKLIN